MDGAAAKWAGRRAPHLAGDFDPLQAFLDHAVGARHMWPPPTLRWLDRRGVTFAGGSESTA